MKRLQFDMPEDRVEELDKLVERTGLRTRVQLVNAALTLFEWAVREREAGNIIASMNEKTGKYKEVEMLGFPPVAERTDDIDSQVLQALSQDAERLLVKIQAKYKKDAETPEIPPVGESISEIDPLIYTFTRFYEHFKSTNTTGAANVYEKLIAELLMNYIYLKDRFPAWEKGAKIFEAPKGVVVKGAIVVDGVILDDLKKVNQSLKEVNQRLTSKKD